MVGESRSAVHFVPGGGTAIVWGELLVLVAPAVNAAFVEAVWDIAEADDGFNEVVELFAREGLASLPDLAVVERLESVLRANRELEGYHQGRRASL